MGSADGAGAGDANERARGGEMRASERRMREVAIRHGSDEATRRQGEATRRQATR